MNANSQGFFISQISMSDDKGATFKSDPDFKAPDSMDWRDKGAVTPVKNQGQCGSCWAFSATGTLEGAHFIKTRKLVSLSEQNIMDCTNNTKYDQDACEGGWPYVALQYIIDNKGIDTEESYPYEGKNDVCRYNAAHAGATVQSYVQIQSGNEKELMEAVTKYGPVSVGIQCTNNFQLYLGGVLVDPLCDQNRDTIDHAVLVVGYGTENGQDYWLVKNSWAEDWGDEGYIKMARNKGNMCMIASAAVYPRV